MGINFNNFMNTATNQRVAETLQKAHDLKQEWRDNKENDSLSNILEDSIVKDNLEQEMVNVLFKDNRNVLENQFGRYHFTVSTEAGFYYAWKFSFNKTDFYIYASKNDTRYEVVGNVREGSTNKIEFLRALVDYLK